MKTDVGMPAFCYLPSSIYRIKILNVYIEKGVVPIARGLKGISL